MRALMLAAIAAGLTLAAGTVSVRAATYYTQIQANECARSGFTGSIVMLKEPNSTTIRRDTAAGNVKAAIQNNSWSSVCMEVVYLDEYDPDAYQLDDGSATWVPVNPVLGVDCALSAGSVSIVEASTVYPGGGNHWIFVYQGDRFFFKIKQDRSQHYYNWEACGSPAPETTLAD